MKKTSYRFGKYSDTNKCYRWNSYGITEFKPTISDVYEEEVDNKVELPFVVLSILAIIVVVINIPGVF